jgi:hypothetical protein
VEVEMVVVVVSGVGVVSVVEKMVSALLGPR